MFISHFRLRIPFRIRGFIFFYIKLETSCRITTTVSWDEIVHFVTKQFAFSTIENLSFLFLAMITSQLVFGFGSNGYLAIRPHVFRPLAVLLISS